jgi:hypothetical protein
MSTNLTAVLEELLQNTTNLKVLRQLMTTDATQALGSGLGTPMKSDIFCDGVKIRICVY